MNILELIEMNKYENKILQYLLKHDECLSREIEHSLTLSQPCVCSNLNKLIKRGFVSRRQEHKVQKGRPQFYYSIPDKREAINKLIFNCRIELSSLSHSVTKYEETLKSLIKT